MWPYTGESVYRVLTNSVQHGEMETNQQVQADIIPDNSVKRGENGIAPMELEVVCDGDRNGAELSSLQKTSTSSTDNSNYNYQSEGVYAGTAGPIITQSSSFVSRKVVTRVEVVALVVVVAIVWGLLALPIIFYHLPSVSLCLSFFDAVYVLHDFMARSL